MFHQIWPSTGSSQSGLSTPGPIQSEDDDCFRLEGEGENMERKKPSFCLFWGNLRPSLRLWLPGDWHQGWRMDDPFDVLAVIGVNEDWTEWLLRNGAKRIEYLGILRLKKLTEFLVLIKMLRLWWMMGWTSGTTTATSTTAASLNHHLVLPLMMIVICRFELIFCHSINGGGH